MVRAQAKIGKGVCYVALQYKASSTIIIKLVIASVQIWCVVDACIHMHKALRGI